MRSRMSSRSPVDVLERCDPEAVPSRSRMISRSPVELLDWYDRHADSSPVENFHWRAGLCRCPKRYLENWPFGDYILQEDLTYVGLQHFL